MGALLGKAFGGGSGGSGSGGSNGAGGGGGGGGGPNVPWNNPDKAKAANDAQKAADAKQDSDANQGGVVKDEYYYDKCISYKIGPGECKSNQVEEKGSTHSIYSFYKIDRSGTNYMLQTPYSKLGEYTGKVATNCKTLAPSKNIGNKLECFSKADCKNSFKVLDFEVREYTSSDNISFSGCSDKSENSSQNSGDTTRSPSDSAVIAPERSIGREREWSSRTPADEAADRASYAERERQAAGPTLYQRADQGLTAVFRPINEAVAPYIPPNPLNYFFK